MENKARAASRFRRKDQSRQDAVLEWFSTVRNGTCGRPEVDLIDVASCRLCMWEGRGPAATAATPLERPNVSIPHLFFSQKTRTADKFNSAMAVSLPRWREMVIAGTKNG